MNRSMLIAIVIVVAVLILILWYAYDRCYLGKYSTKKCSKQLSSFCGTGFDPVDDSKATGRNVGGYADFSSDAAAAEAGMMYALQFGDDPKDYSVDSFAARKLSRDRAAFATIRKRSNNIRSNLAQTSARQARFDSMREGFGGPAQAGFGWSPNEVDVAASPATGGWGDAQSLGAARCYQGCIDGCVGTHCTHHCADQCRHQSLIDVTSTY